MPLRALIIDFNSYFASVEQQDRPELRGKPVAIAPVLTDYTSCIAASLHAKARGVKTGTRVADAKVLCPDITILEARPPLYIAYHHKLIKAVDSCLPVTEVMSIDEMRCNLTGKYREKEVAVACAHQIKQKIRTDVGECLTSSIGIAPNGFLAKTASDMMKPDGLVVLEDQDLPEKLFTLELRDFVGIGPRMEMRLNRAGITTVRQLYALPIERLHKIWGSIEGRRLYSYLRGVDLEREVSKHKSVGHSHVLKPEHRYMAMAEATLQALLQKAAMRLRSLGKLTAGMGVIVEFKEGDSWKGHRSFQETADTLELIRIFQQLWATRPDLHGRSPVFVGVSFRPLVSPANTTMSFLTDPAQQRLSAALDNINHLYGKNTVYFGGAGQAIDHTPVRIAFTNVPDLDAECELEDEI